MYSARSGNFKYDKLFHKVVYLIRSGDELLCYVNFIVNKNANKYQNEMLMNKVIRN